VDPQGSAVSRDNGVLVPGQHSVRDRCQDGTLFFAEVPLARDIDWCEIANSLIEPVFCAARRSGRVTGNTDITIRPKMPNGRLHARTIDERIGSPSPCSGWALYRTGNTRLQ
jgi:hypothetical protein